MSVDFDENTWVLIVLGIVGIGGVGLYIGNVDLSSFPIALGMVVVVVGIFLVLRWEEVVNTINLGRKSTDSGTNYDFDDAEEIVQDWGKERFKGVKKKKGVQIDWSRSKSEPIPIITDFDEMSGVVIRHFYATHGSDNKPMNFFVDVTNGKVFAVDQVDTVKKKKQPLRTLEAYKMTWRLINRGALRRKDDSHDVPNQIQGIPLAGTYPVDESGGNDG